MSVEGLNFSGEEGSFGSRCNGMSARSEMSWKSEDRRREGSKVEMTRWPSPRPRKKLKGCLGVLVLYCSAKGKEDEDVASSCKDINAC